MKRSGVEGNAKKTEVKVDERSAPLCRAVVRAE